MMSHWNWRPSVFYDPRLLTVADVEHSGTQERWFSIGVARNGAVLSVVYLWSEADPAMLTPREAGSYVFRAECYQNVPK
jgi:hypothetical protein